MNFWYRNFSMGCVVSEFRWSPLIPSIIRLRIIHYSPTRLQYLSDKLVCCSSWKFSNSNNALHSCIQEQHVQIVNTQPSCWGMLSFCQANVFIEVMSPYTTTFPFEWRALSNLDLSSYFYWPRKCQNIVRQNDNTRVYLYQKRKFFQN